jgi:hypothetical protein
MREINELISQACQQIQSLDDFLELGQACLPLILETTESIPVSHSRYQHYIIFVDRFVLEKVLEIQRVNYVALYHNDVQRKGKKGISSTFSPDIYMVLCHVFGDLPLYYLDPPVVANELRFQQKIKTFDTFILYDLWNL